MQKKVWIFCSPEEFSSQQEGVILARLNDFFSQWQAHGADLQADVTLLEGHFIKVEVDQEVAKATGCSIDKLTHQIKLLEEFLHLELLNRMWVFYKPRDQMVVEKLKDFTAKVKIGEVSPHALLYNTGVSSVQEFEAHWMVELKDSWAAKWLS